MRLAALTTLVGLGVLLTSCGEQVEAVASPTADAVPAAIAPTIAPTSEICVEGRTYQGCCSGSGGVSDIRGVKLRCADGDRSTSCNGVEINLQGCCSDNEGVKSVGTDGWAMCNNDERSETCRLNRCDPTDG